MTNAPQKNSPMLKAAPLWAKSSVKGGQYLTGRLGGVKVLILENRDRQSDDEPSHQLFFVEASDRRQGGQDIGQRDAGERDPRHVADQGDAAVDVHRNRGSVRAERQFGARTADPDRNGDALVRQNLDEAQDEHGDHPRGGDRADVGAPPGRS